MTERETAAELADLRVAIDESYGFWGADDLRDAVGEAIDVSAPPGRPDVIASTAGTVGGAAASVDRALSVVSKLRQANLPTAWSGDAHTAATAALQALERELNRACESLLDAKRVFADHADALRNAQEVDRRGMDPLRYAKERLSHVHTWQLGIGYHDEDVHAAHQAAMSGVGDRTRGADQARDSAERAAKLLRDLAGAARLSHLSGSRLDPVTELLIAGAGGGGDADELSLNPVMADRAREAIDRLSPGDRARLEALLTQAASPAEQAYILKAMAAGYDMNEVAAFDRLINDHGGDERWLHDRLAPLDTSDAADNSHGQQSTTTSHGRKWTQGQYPTCVASSNVMARAQVDPLYALQLTTGGHPDDPAYDSPDGFAGRLRAEQERIYDDGRNWWQNLRHEEGMNSGQSEDIANQNIAPRTGVEYDDHDIDNPDERRAALAKAEDAVDRGLPVPFASREGDRGHEMLIVGHDGDMVQIYNPWGYTVWVNEDDFINGHMNAVEAKVPNTPMTIRLPR